MLKPAFVVCIAAFVYLFGCTVKHEHTVKLDIPKLAWEKGLTDAQIKKLKPGWEAGSSAQMKILEEAFKPEVSLDDQILAIRRANACIDRFFTDVEARDMAAGDRYRKSMEGKSVADLAREQRAIEARK